MKLLFVISFFGLSHFAWASVYDESTVILCIPKVHIKSIVTKGGEPKVKFSILEYSHLILDRWGKEKKFTKEVADEFTAPSIHDGKKRVYKFIKKPCSISFKNNEVPLKGRIFRSGWELIRPGAVVYASWWDSSGELDGTKVTSFGQRFALCQYPWKIEKFEISCPKKKVTSPSGIKPQSLPPVR